MEPAPLNPGSNRDSRSIGSIAPPLPKSGDWGVGVCRLIGYNRRRKGDVIVTAG